MNIYLEEHQSVLYDSELLWFTRNKVVCATTVYYSFQLVLQLVPSLLELFQHLPWVHALHSRVRLVGLFEKFVNFLHLLYVLFHFYVLVRCVHA